MDTIIWFSDQMPTDDQVMALQKIMGSDPKITIVNLTFSDSKNGMAQIIEECVHNGSKTISGVLPAHIVAALIAKFPDNIGQYLLLIPVDHSHFDGYLLNHYGDKR